MESDCEQGCNAKRDISPDFLALRGHKCCNNTRSGSNKFPLGTPLFFQHHKLENSHDLVVQIDGRRSVTFQSPSTTQCDTNTPGLLPSVQNQSLEITRSWMDHRAVGLADEPGWVRVASDVASVNLSCDNPCTRCADIVNTTGIPRGFLSAGLPSRSRHRDPLPIPMK